MASSRDCEQERQPLNETENSFTSTSTDRPTASGNRAPGPSNARHRPIYTRAPSAPSISEHNYQQADSAEDEIPPVPPLPSGQEGLGIRLPQPLRQVEYVVTKQAQKKSLTGGNVILPDQPSVGSAKPLLSPPSTAGLSGSTNLDSGFDDVDTSYAHFQNSPKQSHASLRSEYQPSPYADSDVGFIPLRPKQDDFIPERQCRSKTRIKRPKLTWVPIMILVLAVYGTIMSALFLAIAAKGQPWGTHIRTNSRLTSSGASILTTFFGKTIELSFVTVMVALLGQALARRAYDKRTTTGITLAQISMRSWILQPGSLVSRWESVRYAGTTALGVIAMFAALFSLLYVTAANALVQPQLKFQKSALRSMQGLVKTSFANPRYTESICRTPIDWMQIDHPEGGPTCLQLEHAAMGYHNYYAYLSTWKTASRSGNSSDDFSHRPPGYALFNDNTTITAPWIERENNNMTALNDEWGRIIVNVSMAMPHAGVVSASMDPINKILQPDDLDGQGLYSVHASVPSPVVHVLCAMLNDTDLEPFILQEDQLTHELSLPKPYNATDLYLGGTPWDDLFKWGSKHGEHKYPPLFSHMPIGYNTIINDTLNMSITYGRESIYLLGNSSDPDQPQKDPHWYPLCQIQVSQTPLCSTRYNASRSGATLEAICEDEDNDMAYIRSLTNATNGNLTLQKEWPNIAGEWSKSLALNNGKMDGNGSNSRVLNQLVPQDIFLPKTLPSIAEALAVMAGCTLLMSTQDAPFVPFFNYNAPNNILDPGQYQYFNASVEAQEYSSGGTEKYQRGFIFILFGVVAWNILALVYFLMHRDWYSDVSEPTNLFSLAMNSPPSKELAGSCGGGPQGKQFRSRWKLQETEGHLYMESVEVVQLDDSPGSKHRKRLSEGFDMVMTPVKRASGTITKRWSR